MKLWGDIGMRGERDKIKLSWPINLLANMSKYLSAVGASSQERHEAAVIVAEAYEEARSLTQIELDLMAKVIRVSDRTERQMDIQDSSVGDEILGVPAGDYAQAAARWRGGALESLPEKKSPLYYEKLEFAVCDLSASAQGI